MRLIDADELKEELSQQWFIDILLTKTNSNDMYSALAEKIDSQPTAYDVDKVVEHLETARDGYSTAMCMTATNAELVKRFIAKDKAMNLAIEIVKAGGMNNNSKTRD